MPGRTVAPPPAAEEGAAVRGRNKEQREALQASNATMFLRGNFKSFCPCQSKALKSLVYTGFRALILFFVMTLFFQIIIFAVDYRQL